MKKIKLLFVLLIAIGGALLIYYHFDNKRSKEIVMNKFNSEYNLGDENNLFEYKTIDQVLDLFNNKTGIIFLCTPTSNWCHKYAYYLNDTLKEGNYQNEVYYLDISKERALNTFKYQRLLDYLNIYLYTNDQGNSKINMPDLTFIKDGNIVFHDNETSLIHSDVKEDEYWNINQIKDFKNKIISNLEVIK